MKPTLLFSPRHTSEAVMARLAEEGEYRLVGFEDMGREFMDRHGVRPFSSYLDREKDGPDLEAATRDSLGRMLPVLSSDDFLEAVARHLGRGPDFARASGERFRRILEKVLPQVIYLIKGLENLQNSEDLRLVVIHDQLTWQWRTLGLAARMFSIPVFYLPHTFGISVVWGMPGGGRGTTSPYLDFDFVDKVVICNEIEKQVLTGRNLPLEKMTLAGHPSLDDYVRFADEFYADEKNSRSSVWSRVGVDPSDKIVLFATSWGGSTVRLSVSENKMWRDFRMVARAMKDLEESEGGPPALVVKFHPNIKQMDGGAQRVIDWHKRLADRENLKNIHFLYIDKEGLGTRELLAASDVMIATASSTIIEALILRTRVVFLDPYPDQTWSWKPLVDGASTSRSLREVLARLIKAGPVDWEGDPEFRRGVAQFSYGLDGRALDRVVAAIKETAGNGEGGS